MVPPQTLGAQVVVNAFATVMRGPANVVANQGIQFGEVPENASAHVNPRVSPGAARLVLNVEQGTELVVRLQLPTQLHSGDGAYVLPVSIGADDVCRHADGRPGCGRFDLQAGVVYDRGAPGDRDTTQVIRVGGTVRWMPGAARTDYHGVATATVAYTGV
jgi:hypothetical protein